MSVKQRSEIFRSFFKTIIKRNGNTGKKNTYDSVPDFPQYNIICRLGKGGMASVFHAEKISTGRQVALKVIADDISDDANWLERFLIEAENLAHLSHSNIVPVFDWGTHNGKSYIEMELMKGGDLSSWFLSHSPTVGNVINITRQIANGLDFAGKKGFVHRDIKPDNILFREDGTPCISDFGIAKNMSSDTTISSRGLVIGTGAYLSPEQANPKGRKLDQRSDLYSLGILLYELLTGEKPFEFDYGTPEERFFMYLNAHINLSPPPLPRQLSRIQPIMNKLLAKEPDDRFNRGQELAKALFELEKSLNPKKLQQPLPGLSKIPSTPAQKPLHDQQRRFSNKNAQITSRDAAKTNKAALPLMLPMLIFAPIIGGTVWYFGNSNKETYSGTMDVVSSDKPSDTELPQISINNVPIPTKNIPDPLTDLLIEAKDFKPVETSDTSEQAHQINTYKKILEIAPDNSLAEKQLNRILEFKVSEIEKKIANNQLKDLENSLAVVRLINSNSAQQITNLINNKQKQNSLNLAMEEINQLIEESRDTSSKSLDKLLTAQNLINKLEKNGAKNVDLDSLRYQIETKFEIAILSSIQIATQSSADNAEKWLSSAKQTSMPLNKLKQLKTSLSSLNTSLARAAKQREQLQQISALENKIKSHLQAANTVNPSTYDELLEANNSLNKAVNQGLSVQKSENYRKDIRDKFILNIKKQINEMSLNDQITAKTWLESANEMGLKPDTVRVLNQEYAQAVAAIESQKQLPPNKDPNALSQKGQTRKIEATIPSI
jgi:serine/threonine protein kinase